MRGIFEALGAEIFWNDATKTVKANDSINKVRLTIDNNIAQINGKEIKLDVAPTIINSRTMVPVRFVAEAFDCEVEWDSKRRTVYITGSEPEENFYFADQD